jgi:murein DD-endopeptidase MepM/ murein hydrolase activator NlpD
LDSGAVAASRLIEIETAPLEALFIHPLHAEEFACTEHRGGDYVLGDRFGTDCTILHNASQDESRYWLAPYRGTGQRNEDWFGWGKVVLAPFDGIVEEVRINQVVNRVGQVGSSPATAIVFLRDDSARVLFGHLGTVRVKAGERVRAGDSVGTVGNNGVSRSPHTHVGAWRGDTAMQVRFDIRKR